MSSGGVQVFFHVQVSVHLFFLLRYLHKSIKFILSGGDGAADTHTGGSTVTATVKRAFRLGYAIGKSYGPISRRQAELYLRDSTRRRLTSNLVDVLMNGVDDGANGDDWRVTQ